jgi:hypothetical protein
MSETKRLVENTNGNIGGYVGLSSNHKTGIRFQM